MWVSTSLPSVSNRLLIERERLVALAAPQPRLGLEAEQALAGRIVAAGLGHDGERVVHLVRFEPGLDPQRIEAGIGAAVAAGAIDRGDAGVELAELEVGDANRRAQRDQRTGVLLAFETGDGRSQGIDDGAVLAAIGQHLGERVVTGDAIGLELDDAAGGALGALVVVARPLDFDEQERHA